MTIRTTLLYASALLLVAVSLPASANAKKFDCRYRMTLADESAVPMSHPEKSEMLLAAWQKQELIRTAMAERSVPDAGIVQALAQVVGK